LRCEANPDVDDSLRVRGATGASTLAGIRAENVTPALGAAVLGNTVDERAVFDLAAEFSVLTDWCRSASPAQFKDTVGRPLWPRVAYRPMVE
jgi:hypothetical protein